MERLDFFFFFFDEMRSIIYIYRFFFFLRGVETQTFFLFYFIEV